MPLWSLFTAKQDNLAVTIIMRVLNVLLYALCIKLKVKHDLSIGSVVLV